MPAYQPDLTDVHVDKLLTAISVGYKNENYIAPQVAPFVLVEKESDIVPQYVQDFWFRDVAQKMAPGDKTPRSGFTVDNTLKYSVDEYGIGKEIPDRIRANTDQPYDLDKDAALWVAEMIHLRWEAHFGTNIFNTGKWTGSSTGLDLAGNTDFTKWSDYGLSDPVADIRKQRRAIRQKIGRHGNILILAEDVMDTLIDHPLLVERVKYSGGDVAESLISKLARIDKVLVGSSMQATNAEGATLALADIFTDDALLLYLPASPGRFQPSAIYTFVQREYSGADKMVIRRFRDDERRVDTVEGRTLFDMKIIDARAGAFFNDAI